MKIIGLRIEKYIGQNISGHNCDFEYHDEEMERHILCGITSDGENVEITLSEEYGECGSGWCTASWGNMEVNKVSKFNGYTYKPVKDLNIDDFDPESDYVNNEVFTFSLDGDDSYYPSGFYEVNMDLFKQTIRHKETRPVWIFKGESNSGKSFIASRLNDLSVYETDTSDELPDKITEDIVVLGNKYQYDIEKIKDCIFGECELILVDFKGGI
jgi:hypothetical protein